MPLTTEEKLLALSREPLRCSTKPMVGSSGVQTRACQGHPADRHVCTVRGSRVADAGAASAPEFHAGDGALLGLCGDPDGCRQQPAECGPARLCGSLSPGPACPHRHHRSFGRQLPGAHRRGTRRVPQCGESGRRMRPWRPVSTHSIASIELKSLQPRGEML